MKKSSKNILNCCKLQIVFKNKTKLGSKFHSKDRIPKDLTFGVVCIGTSTLTTKQVKPKNSSVSDLMTILNGILTRENKKFLLELKKSLLQKFYGTKNI